MPLQIVRNDITKMKADAIVNATNEALIPGGSGVDASIHAAAGTKLAEALEKIGSCRTGSAVLTEAYGISQCKYIIHAVSPVWSGREEERQLLKQCYESIFRLTAEYGLQSVAMPVLAAGANGFPREAAYAEAAGAARRFLASGKDEVMIYLVLFGEDMVEISSRQNETVQQYITENYCEMNHAVLAEEQTPQWKHRMRLFDNLPDDLPYVRVGATAPEPEKEELLCVPCAMPSLEWEREEKEDYAAQDKSFGEMCDWWREKKHISISDFYSRANLSRSAFYYVRRHPEQMPRKTTAFACVIGLQLTLEEANDLLMRAGIAFSPYYRTDMIVREYIENEDYDIDRLNLELFEEDLALLGSVSA